MADAAEQQQQQLATADAAMAEEETQEVDPAGGLALTPVVGTEPVQPFAAPTQPTPVADTQQEASSMSGGRPGFRAGAW